jgi:hypothetical protein
MLNSPLDHPFEDRSKLEEDQADGLRRGLGEPRSFAPARDPAVAADQSLAPFAPSALCDPEGVQADLAHWNHERLGPALPTRGWHLDLKRQGAMLLLESTWIETLRDEVYDRAQAAPRTPAAFIAWFEELKASGPGQNDPLFPWLAEHADEEAMRWFLTQEAAGEAGFDDLVALTQVKLPTEAKLELARNYWDEMGRGNVGGMHGPMLTRAIETLGLTPSIDQTVWQSLALANTMTAFATVRRYAWHSVGALGVVELTAPGRVSLVGAGLKRLGFPPVVRKYFDLHAVLDIKHSEDWNANALRPLAEQHPECLPFIAEGALMRLLCGERCFDRYREHFKLAAAPRAAARPVAAPSILQ